MFNPMVVYADFEPSIDGKGIHRPIMLTCLAVSQIPSIKSELRTFLAPHESEKDMFDFMTYLLKLRKRVMDYLFDERRMEHGPLVKEDYENTEECPFCNTPFVPLRVRR